MKTLEEKAFEYCKREICPTCSDNGRCIKKNRIGDCIPTYMEYAAFIAGYKAAQEWISVEDELPKVEKTPYQVLGKNIMNGQFETYFIEYSNKNIKEECTHWRPINND